MNLSTVGQFVFGWWDTEGQLDRYLQKMAADFFSAEDEEKKAILNVDAFEARKERIRNHFFDAIGGLPVGNGSLNPKITGVLERDGYRIEKVIFESLPRFYVTGNLYVPNAPDVAALGSKGGESDIGKGGSQALPAVLFVCGHHEAAKAAPEYQRVCLELVRAGFVVFAIDPIGQGERMQYYDPTLGRTTVSWGTTEHSYYGFQATLAGGNVARYFIWDAMRAVDYLISRPEVDPDRIGVTGNSGGGTQTSYLMLAEPRFKAAMPCTFITSRDQYIKTGQAHDAEQNIFGAIKVGLNYDDFISCFAPRPAMIGAVEWDFFPIEGTLQSFERAKRVYSLYGVPENVALAVTSGGHAYNHELRQACVNWFKKHLQGEESAFVTKRDEDIPVEPIDKLWCTKSGQILGDFSDAMTVFDLNLEFAARVARWRGTAEASGAERGVQKRSARELKEEIMTILGLDRERLPIRPRVIGQERHDDYEAKRVFFFSEPDIAVCSLCFTPCAGTGTAPVDGDTGGGTRQKALLLLLDDGTRDLPDKWPWVEDYLRRGWSVFVFDPRGVGATRSRRINPGEFFGFYGTEFRQAYDAMMMGTSLFAMRVFDVTRGIDYLRATFGSGCELGIAGEGMGALYALHAAVVEPEVKYIELDGIIRSFWDLVATRNFKYDPRLEAFGLLQHWDIPELLDSLEGRKVVCRNVRDGRGEKLE